VLQSFLQTNTAQIIPDILGNNREQPSFTAEISYQTRVPEIPHNTKSYFSSPPAKKKEKKTKNNIVPHDYFRFL